MTDDLELTEIGNYHGTEQYHVIGGGFSTLATDGVAYIMNNGYSWFVTDSIAVLELQFKKKDFLCIELHIFGGQAKMVIKNGGGKELYVQDYTTTNCKKNLTLYWMNNVLMLSSEY